jgi:hypothetical protein
MTQPCQAPEIPNVRLMVVDEPEIRVYRAKMAAFQGFDVQSAASAMEAERLFAASDFELVILDLCAVASGMPVGVIVTLEEVDVDHHNRVRTVVTHCVRMDPSRRLLESPSVADSQQRVFERQSALFCLSLCSSNAHSRVRRSVSAMHGFRSRRKTPPLLTASTAAARSALPLHMMRMISECRSRYAAQQFDAVHVWHPQVAHDRPRRAFFAELGQSFCAAAHGNDVMTKKPKPSEPRKSPQSLLANPVAVRCRFALERRSV